MNALTLNSKREEGDADVKQESHGQTFHDHYRVLPFDVGFLTTVSASTGSRRWHSTEMRSTIDRWSRDAIDPRTSVIRFTSTSEISPLTFQWKTVQPIFYVFYPTNVSTKSTLVLPKTRKKARNFNILTNAFVVTLSTYAYHSWYQFLVTNKTSPTALFWH